MDLVILPAANGRIARLNAHMHDGQVHTLALGAPDQMRFVRDRIAATWRLGWTIDEVEAAMVGALEAWGRIRRGLSSIVDLSRPQRPLHRPGR